MNGMNANKTEISAGKQYGQQMNGMNSDPADLSSPIQL